MRLAFSVWPICARLHQGGMQVQIVGHHGGADDPDGHVEAVPVEARNKTSNYLVYQRLSP